MRLHYWFFTILYCAGIFTMSHKSGLTDFELPFEGVDKLIHAVMYAGLAAVVSFGMRRSGKPLSSARQLCLPFLFAALYGFSDEVHQYFVPGRHFDPLDILADAAGAAAIQLALWAFWRRGKPRSPE
jgi:VanZ family protein